MRSRDGIAKIADVFFNGRKADETARRDAERKPSISVMDLVARGTSVVRCGGKIYRITVEEVEATK